MRDQSGRPADVGEVRDPGWDEEAEGGKREEREEGKREDLHCACGVGWTWSIGVMG